MSDTDTRSKLEHLFKRLVDPTVPDLDALADFVWFRKLALGAEDVAGALGMPAPATPAPTKDGPRMPFGEHKGKLLAEVPATYFAWLVTRELREPLFGHVKTEAARRGVKMPAGATAAKPNRNAGHLRQEAKAHDATAAETNQEQPPF